MSGPESFLTLRSFLLTLFTGLPRGIILGNPYSSLASPQAARFLAAQSLLEPLPHPLDPLEQSTMRYQRLYVNLY